MKKHGFTITMVFVALFGCAFLTGCPIGVNPPVDTTPVVNPPATEFGSLHMEGNYAPIVKKDFSNGDMLRTGNTFIGETDAIRASLYEPLQKGGGAIAEFDGVIQDGRFVLDSADSGVFIPVGIYSLYVETFYNGCPLFYGKPEGGLVQINAGSNQVDIIFDFMDWYWLNVSVGAVPAKVLSEAVAYRIISADYPQSGSLYADAGKVNFTMGGKVQFTGGTVVFLDLMNKVILDASGNPYASELVVDMATNYGNLIQATYQQSQNIGTLMIDSIFSFSSKILINGEIVKSDQNSFQNALWNAGKNVEIYVPEGEFYLGDVIFRSDVFSVVIHGEGMKSRIHGRFILDYIDRGKSAEKGGQTRVAIDGVMVLDSMARTHKADATVFMNGVDVFAMNNCAVLTNSDTGISLSYVADATIDHSNILRWGPYVHSAISVTNCGPAPVSLKNSILTSFPVVVSYDRPGAYAGFYNCIWDCTNYTNLLDSTPPSFTKGKPLWSNDFVLLPGSPCLGTGENGEDMGILQPDHSQGPLGK